MRPGRCSLAVFPVQHQTAEASRRKLEEEVTTFLSVLKNDGLAESKVCLDVFKHMDIVCSIYLFIFTSIS